MCYCTHESSGIFLFFFWKIVYAQKSLTSTSKGLIKWTPNATKITTVPGISYITTIVHDVGRSTRSSMYVYVDVAYTSNMGSSAGTLLRD